MLILLFYTFFPRGYFNSMNQIRQGVAIAIVLFAVKYIIRKEIAKYITCVIIATLFHYSAIVLILLYWCSSFKFSTRKSLIIFFVIFICRLVDVPRKIMDIAAFIPTMLNGKYANYIVGFTEDGSFPGFFLIVLLIYGLALFVKCHNTDLEYQFLFNMTTLCICVMIFFPGSMPAARYRDYFLMFFIVFSGLYIDYLGKRFNYMIVYLFILVMATYFLYSVGHIANLNDSAISGISGGNINYEFNFNLLN